MNRNNHLHIERQVHIFIISISNFIGGTCPLGPSTNGLGPLLENRVSIMTMTTTLSTGRRSLRLGPLVMHMNTILLARRMFLLLLTRFKANLLATVAYFLSIHLFIDKVCKELGQVTNTI
jgi:hypothetical protein